MSIADKEVTISGAPFQIRFKMKVPNAKPKTREFVTVLYDGKLYNVLNSFKKIRHPNSPNWISSDEMAELGLQPNYKINDFVNQQRSSQDTVFGINMKTGKRKNNGKP